MRRRHCVGGAPVNFGLRRRRGMGGQKQFFLRFTKKIRSILKIFLGTFLVVKALRFADDQCSESDLQRMMDRLNMVSVNYNMIINTKMTNVFHSFIHSGHFYSAPSSPLPIRGAPDYSADTVLEFHAEAHRQLQVKDLARAGVEPTTLRLRVIASTN